MVTPIKKVLLTMCLAVFGLLLTACSGNGSAKESVVIATNGDEEAKQAMVEALNQAGYEGKYVVQSLGTSELGGKMLAEGKSIEADLVTMSSYFIESAQAQHDMFRDLTFETNALEETPDYYTPLLSNTGAIFVNTKMLEEEGLEMPTSIKDLAKPEMKGLVSIPNMAHSSTGWLLVQAVLSEYGKEEGKKVLRDLIRNVGPHLESSGSGPINKVKAGEVAVGFGLRHQAVQAQEEGAPISYIDPLEGNFSLTESVAVVDKEEETPDLAMEMAEVLVKDAREALLSHYPVALYEVETVDDANKPKNAKKFSEPLTVELLEEHLELFEQAQKESDQ